MSTLFQDIESNNLEPNWASIVDWLFDESRFKGNKWDSKAKIKFTNKLKSFGDFDSSRFGKKTKNHRYPIFATKRNRKKKPFAVFSSNESLGVDFIRHIRNGIAHGHAECYSANKECFIEIYDFYNGAQTAYIAIPIRYLNEFHRIYNRVEND